MKVATLNFVRALGKEKGDNNKDIEDPFFEARVLSSLDEEVILSNILSDKTLRDAELMASTFLASIDVTFLGFSNQLTFSPLVNITQFKPSNTKYLFNYDGKNESPPYLVGSDSAYGYKALYLPILYEGDDIKNGFLDVATLYAINRLSREANLYCVGYGSGSGSLEQIAKYRDVIYDGVMKITTQPYSPNNIYLIPFHPIEHFYDDETIDDAITTYDLWVVKFHLLRELFNAIGIKYFVIMGFEEWLINPPDNEELSMYLDSHPMGDYFVQRSLINERKKEQSDECIITEIEGMSRVPVVTIVSWLKETETRNSELYYAVEGLPPIENIKLFCESHAIAFEKENRFLNDKTALKRLRNAISDNLEN